MVDKDSTSGLDKNGSGDGDAPQSYSDQEREWAQNALNEFNKGNYSASLQFLTKLEVSFMQDAKLAHNKAVVDYYKSEVKKTDQFKKALNAIGTQAQMNLDDPCSLEDVENCVLYFNQAVLLFHLKQYGSALRIINKVFTFIEPMEESLAQRVCLLLLELLLVTHQPEKALAQIAYIEQQFVSTSTAIVNKLSSDKDLRATEKSEKEKVPEPLDAATHALRLRLLQYRVRCYLKTQQLRTCKRELKNIVLSSGAVSFEEAITEREELNNNANIVPIFLKGNLEYLRGNYRKAIKILNSVPQNAPSFKDTGESIPVMYYNNMGCLHHYMAKPNLACFYLQRALQEEDNALKSFPKVENAEGLNGRPLFALGSSRNLELKYNLGVALLHAGKPLLAFDYLLEAVQVFHMNPRLWLRLAECCIMVHKTSNSADFNLSARRQDMVQGVIGSGLHKKIILSPQLAKEGVKLEESSCAIPVPKVEFASLCLRNALLLLNDYTASLKNGTASDTVQSSLRLGTSHLSALGGALSGLGTLGGAGPSLGFGTGAAARAPVQEACYGAPSSPLNINEVDSLRCSVLADSAYVALCLGDYVMALHHAQQLLDQTKLSGAHKLLGHLYAGEALLMCNKISDAIEHLNPENIKDVSIAFPGMEHLEKERERDKEKEKDYQCEAGRPLQAWTPSKLGTARAVLQYNLAVAFATRGELDKAGETLKQVFAARSPDCEVPIHVVMLALYLELQLGHSDVSRNIVKQHCPQYR